MQIAHLLFSEEALNTAVSLYRERVREDDTPELKGLLQQTAFRQACKLEGETLARAKQLLENMLIQDMQEVFEPEPGTETEETASDPGTETEGTESDLEKLKAMETASVSDAYQAGQRVRFKIEGAQGKLADLWIVGVIVQSRADTPKPCYMIEVENADAAGFKDAACSKDNPTLELFPLAGSPETAEDSP